MAPAPARDVSSPASEGQDPRSEALEAQGPRPEARLSSLEKALEVCETLAAAPRGLSVTELARAVGQPAPTVHRLLTVLKRRGYVRQDEQTSRYSLSLKMLDLSFRLLGRSELRLHAYPVVREYVLRTGSRAFIAVPDAGEVTYVWPAGPDEAAMHTQYGRVMPGHCALFFSEGTAPRRLSCLRLARKADLVRSEEVVARLESGGAAARERLNCTCAPVFDYTSREVARVGVFAHAGDEASLLTADHRAAWEVAERISLRLGHLPTAHSAGVA